MTDVSRLTVADSASVSSALIVRSLLLIRQQYQALRRLQERV